MSTVFQTCPKCESFILSDTYECPECGCILDEARASASRPTESEKQDDIRKAEMYDTCRSCGEQVRTGLVRCWNCNAFMREDVEARYKEMTSTPQHIIFSDVPADERTELIPERTEDGLFPWAKVYDADDTEFSLRDGSSTAAPSVDDDDFELDPRTVPSPATPNATPAKPSTEAPAADSAETDKEARKEDTAGQSEAASAPAKKPSADSKPPGEIDADDLLNIALQDQRETRRRKRQKLEEARKQRILMPCTCGAWIRVRSDQAGRVVRCRQCKTPVVVPVMKKKDKDGSQARKKAAEIKLTWLEDIQFHAIQPTNVVLKPGSLEKVVETVDAVFHESGLYIIRYAAPTKKGLFSRSDDVVPPLTEQRELAQKKIRSTGKIADIPHGELLHISPDRSSTIRLIQPVAQAHESMFAGVPVFGEGRIAIYLPLDLPENQQAFCSFPISVARRFSRHLESLFGVHVPLTENGVPEKEEYTMLKCHFSDVPIRSLKNVVYYQKDPNYELELAGHVCSTCGIAMTEDARARKKLGGAAGKGLARAKCPKCSNKFGDQKAWNVVKAPEADEAEEEDVSEVLKAKTPAASGSRGKTDSAASDVQGRWKMVSLAQKGDFANPVDMSGKAIVFAIDGDLYTITAGDKVVEKGLLKIDNQHSPAHFDQVVQEGADAGKTHLGLYRIVEGKLENCQAPVGKPRPTSFDAPRNQDASLAVFERLT